MSKPARRLTKLKRAYLRYNRLYFKSELPTDLPVLWTRGLPAHCYGIMFDDTIILINMAYRHLENVWRLSLLHEMAHQACKSERKHHGKKWLRTMRSLARRGAFDELW